ncbi:hypothetical protein DFH09DRAFT_1279846 [Mycena vulgaris]|nr:hypothetical protein DFH09DRAFT_1279846 [Mycena vulgaris]
MQVQPAFLLLLSVLANLSLAAPIPYFDIEFEATSSTDNGVGSGGTGYPDLSGNELDQDSVRSIGNRRDEWEARDNAIAAIGGPVKRLAGGLKPDNQTPAF